MKDNEKVQAFLTELTELSRKHGMIIGGCGCCGSPDINDIEEEEKNGHYEYNSNLYWDW